MFFRLEKRGNVSLTSLQLLNAPCKRYRHHDAPEMFWSRAIARPKLFLWCLAESGFCR